MLAYTERDMVLIRPYSVTYGHRLKRIGHPVRSAIHKLQIGRLVVGWVTTSEYLLLYVSFCIFSLLASITFVAKYLYKNADVRRVFVLLFVGSLLTVTKGESVLNDIE
jgi:hypothetical protein